MEPSLRNSKLHRIIFTFVLIIFFAIFLLIPAALKFWDLFEELNFKELHSEFFLIIAHSFFYTCLHSLIACSLLAVLSFIAAYFLFPYDFKFYRFFFPLISLLGWVCFFLPGVSWALLYLFLQQKFTFFAPIGIVPIVSVHFAMNFLILTYLLIQDLRSYARAQESRDLFESSVLMGMNHFAFIKNLWMPRLKNFYQSWMPLIFVWCMNSFSVVLLLSGKTKNSSLELLLFHSLSVGDSETKSFILFFIQTLLTIAMSFAFFKINKTKDLVDVPKNSALEKVELKHLFSSAHKYISYLIVALILIFIGEFIFLTLEKFSSLSTFPNNFFPTLFNTILLSSGVALMAVCMSIMLCFVSSALRRFLFVTMAISAVLILYLWSSSFLNLISESNSLVKFLFLAIAVLMISFPIFTRWINEQLQLIPDDYQSTSILLGLSSWDYFNVIVFPRLKNCFERIFIFAFLITMGDVALSSYILPFEASLLSLMARKASQHYDFSVAPFVFWSQFVICLFFVLLQERKFIFCKKKSTLIEANYA